MAFFGSSWFEEDKPVGPLAHWLEDGWDTSEEEKIEEEEQWHRNVCNNCGLKSGCIMYPDSIKNCIKHE